jgi:BirA family biotin operon repressor/biotin-[acetyl-CoA-carboxylase] ligase
VDTFDLDRYQSTLRTAFIGRRLEHRESVSSTMDVARDMASGQGAHGTVVLADQQTAGRGRRGRSFFSPPGDNLYFTIILRMAPGGIGPLALCVPLAVVDAVRELCPSAAIKWPNDIWIGDRKCSGMLIDAQSEGEDVVALVGIGINVNGDPGRTPELRDIATSLALKCGRRVDREPLLAAILTNLEANLDAGTEAVLTPYREASNTLGRAVHVQPAAGAAFNGVAEDIDANGALVVRRDDGALVVVDAADVSLRLAVA